MNSQSVKTTNASMMIRYAVISLCMGCTNAYVMMTNIKYDVSYDRLALLLVLFNTVAVMGRALAGAFADRLKNKHKGVQLGVMLTVLGYYLPAQFGINLKVTVLALGSCVFHAFASSSLLSRSSFRSKGISLFMGAEILGLALYTFGAVFGHITTALMMMFAIPQDNCEDCEGICVKNAQSSKSQSIQAALLSVLLLFGAVMMSYQFSSFEFPFASFFKNKALMLSVIGIGVAIGGIICDKLGTLTASLAGFFGGSSLIYFCSGNKALCLLGLALISLPISSFVMSVYKFMPEHPALTFALFSSAAYLGQELTFYMPLRYESGIFLIAVMSFISLSLPILLPILSSMAHSDKEVKNEKA